MAAFDSVVVDADHAPRGTTTNLSISLAWTGLAPDGLPQLAIVSNDGVATVISLDSITETSSSAGSWEGTADVSIRADQAKGVGYKLRAEIEATVTYTGDSGNDSFEIEAFPPTISDTVTPNHGPTAGGTTGVIVTGTGFDVGDGGPDADVEMPTGTPATVTENTTTDSITLTTPAHAAGSVKVKVTTPDGSAETTVNAFTYADGNPHSVNTNSVI